MDNFALYALYVFFGSFFLQALGFAVFDVEYRSIDTVPVVSVVDDLHFGALSLFFLSIIVSVFVILFTRRDSGVARTEIMDKNRLYRMSSIVLFLVLVGVLVFASSSGVGVLALFENSSKRIVESVGTAVEFESNGYARFLAGIGGPAFLFYISYFMFYEKKVGKWELVLGGVLFLSAVLPQYMLSARGAALYIFLSIFYMLIIKRLLTVKRLFIGVVVVLMFFSFLTAARYGDDAHGQGGILYAVESRMFYGGGVSLFNTTIIAKTYHDEGADIYGGASYLGILTAPIPRAVWPDKPSFAYDQIVARSIYSIGGFGAQAIPAGVIGESMMNFGYYLSWVSVAFFVWLSIFIHNRIRSLKWKYYSFVLRGVVYPKFASKIFASGLGFALMDAVLILVVVSLLYAYTVTVRRNEHNA